jgi:dethiobiotin synthetase
MSKGWFITGTDTGVGKTRVAEAILRAAVSAGKRAVGMKPIASGCHSSAEGLRNEDAQVLMRAANVAAAYADVNPYAFAPPIAPALAARAAGVTIALDEIERCAVRLAQRADCIVVEGAGGWLAPVGDALTMADVARALKWPVILVVGMRLGCLNHALLTLAAIHHAGLPMAGWIANHVDPDMDRADENVALLEQRLAAPPLAIIPSCATPPPSVLQQLQRALFNSD